MRAFLEEGKQMAHKTLLKSMSIQKGLSASYVIPRMDVIKLCLLGLSANQPAVFFSHTKSAPATSQPAVLCFHNKLTPATGHSQTNSVDT